MERLSEKAIEIINDLHTERLDYNSEYLPLIEAANRLAAYEENTGMDPEAFKKAFNEEVLLNLASQYLKTTPERLRELAKADRDNRLAVLPCKVGDTVWVSGKGRIMECTIEEAHLDGEEDHMFMVSFACDNDCDGCPFNTWQQEYSGEYSCDGEYGQGCVVASDFGKTVFLTHEEAEAALSGKGEEGR